MRVVYRELDSLEHFGRKGMKWGQHIFTDIQDSSRDINDLKKFRQEKVAEANKLARRGGIIGGLMNRKKIQKLLDDAAKDAKYIQDTRDFAVSKFKELLNTDNGKEKVKIGKKMVDKLLDDPDVVEALGLDYFYEDRQGMELLDLIDQAFGKPNYAESRAYNRDGKRKR